MKVTIPVEAINAISRFKSSEETRYYLNGFCLEKHPVEGVLLIITDGHRLAVWHEKNCVIEGDWPLDNIIVRITKYDLQHINAKSDGRSYCHFATIDTEEKSVLIYGSQTASCADSPRTEILQVLKLYNMLINGTYPKWRTVFPKIEKLQPGAGGIGCGFNAKYLGDFGYVEQGRGIFIKLYTGEGLPDSAPVIVLIDNLPNFVGLLMPGRFSPIEESDKYRQAVLVEKAPPE